MTDSRWKFLRSFLNESHDLNKHRNIVAEMLQEGGRARDAEADLQLWGAPNNSTATASVGATADCANFPE
jgi:hypothetical protein